MRPLLSVRSLRRQRYYPPRSGAQVSGSQPGRATSSLRKTNSGSGRRRTPRTQVIDDLEALPSMDYLRRASAVLQLCKTREQCTAAIPLCHIKAGRNQEVVALAEKLMSQDVFLLNPALASAIQACAALGDVDKGFRFFDVAVKRGSIPNLSVYSALLAVADCADPNARSGVEMNDYTFHNLMSAYARGGHVTEALALFDKMQKQGIRADEHTYAILMDAHAESGDFEGAKALMEELKKTSIEPNLVHYNVLLKACGKVSNLTSAFQLYEEMKERKIKPDLVTFITMMHAVYHGELGAVDQKKVKAALVGMGMMGAAFVPFINYEEYMMTTLFCGSLVGSMGLAAYMNPDGVIRALYPNTDEPRDDTVIEAFFRRLREEDHSGRSMYLWREMLKFNVPADPRVYDVLRHPELAYEAVFEEKLPLTDKEGSFVLNLPTTLRLLHSLLAQKRLNMADTLYDAARSHNMFNKVFSEKGDVYVYDMRSFLNEQFVAPNVQFLVQHGYELLDRLDADNASLRTLFRWMTMTRIGATGDNTTSAHYYFRLAVPTERLQKYFETHPQRRQGATTLRRLRDGAQVQGKIARKICCQGSFGF
ncbi:Tetratricopeptide-like helical domain [Phytophthora cactorum]|nr:Tetratricopeptide-like helical domain [Phytophthora cactorum]